VRDALDELPDLLRNALAHVAVVISDGGRREGAYGLYQGDGVGRDRAHDRIIIFRDTLRRDFGHDPDELRNQVVRTVRHELAHHVASTSWASAAWTCSDPGGGRLGLRARALDEREERVRDLLADDLPREQAPRLGARDPGDLVGFPAHLLEHAQDPRDHRLHIARLDRGDDRAIDVLDRATSLVATTGRPAASASAAVKPKGSYLLACSSTLARASSPGICEGGTRPAYSAFAAGRSSSSRV